MIVTYAGNIGSGQGLEKIVPQAAKRLGKDYLFRIIGDGGTKLLLQQKMEELQVENVELINPVSRAELLEYYHQSTFLFLHLNDLNLPNHILFSPTNVDEFVDKLTRYKLVFEERKSFKETFSRKKIMVNMANDILKTVSI